MKHSSCATSSAILLIAALARADSPPIPLPANMVWIPPGTFTMGSTATEPTRNSNEGHQMQVTISEGFGMGKYEVTQGEYQSLMGNNPSYFTGDLNRPVEQVNWNDAVAYCVALTKREQDVGRLPLGYEYRLPTEAQWEYACRAGTTTIFPFGDEMHSGSANFNGTFEYPPCGASPDHCLNPSGIWIASTTAVGSYLPNPWGLYDMQGNVFEWCLDWYANSLPGGSFIDPQGPARGPYRAHRGGSWYFGGYRCRSALRLRLTPDFRDGGLGFRIILASVPIVITQQSMVPATGRDPAMCTFRFQTFAGYYYLIRFKDRPEDRIWQWLRIVLGDGDVTTFTEEMTHASRIYSVQKFTSGFLSFPIEGETPASAFISAVLDHSQPTLCPDGIVVAFTGEEGHAYFGHSAWSAQDLSSACPGSVLYGLPNALSPGDRRPFVVTGSYTGGSPSAPDTRFLYYDGHDGYDFPYGHARKVIAAADGIVHLVGGVANTVRIDHGITGYSTLYLHMLPEDTAMLSDGMLIKRGDKLGYCGSYYKMEGGVGTHLHFEVRKNGLKVDPYGWSGALNRDPLPVDGVAGHDNVILWREF